MLVFVGSPIFQNRNPSLGLGNPLLPARNSSTYQKGASYGFPQGDYPSSTTTRLAASSQACHGGHMMTPGTLAAPLSALPSLVRCLKPLASKMPAVPLGIISSSLAGNKGRCGQKACASDLSLLMKPLDFRKTPWSRFPYMSCGRPSLQGSQTSMVEKMERMVTWHKTVFQENLTSLYSHQKDPAALPPWQPALRLVGQAWSSCSLLGTWNLEQVFSDARSA